MRTEKTEKRKMMTIGDYLTTETQVFIIKKQPKRDISYPKYAFLAKLRRKNLEN